MNLQTSFLSPPFGFALFYLRSVAPRVDYNDRVTNKRIPAVTTAQIYKGALVFIALQLIMLALVLSFPNLVTDRLDKAPKVNLESIKLEAETGDYGTAPDADPQQALVPERSEDKAVPKKAEGPVAEEDPMEAVRRSLEQDAKKNKKK